MKKYMVSVCYFFIATTILANPYHTQGVVKTATGEKSKKVPVYNTNISNEPNGDMYIRTGKVSRYDAGTFTRTTRKKTRKGTYTIETIQKYVIEDDAQHPLEKANIPGIKKDTIIGFVRNPEYYTETIKNQNASLNIPLYEYTGNLQTQSSTQKESHTTAANNDNKK